MRLSCALLLGASLFVLAACGVANDDDASEGDESSESAVIGGRAETDYAAVGFLRDTSTPDYPAICGATLVAPDVVVTAAHCVQSSFGGTPDPSHYLVGWGSVDDTIPGAVRRKVTQILVRDGFIYRSQNDFADLLAWNDVALLKLESAVTDRTPAQIAPPTTTCDHRYVGYGRVVEGGPFVEQGYTGERKSAQMCVAGQNSTEILIQGVDGGNCWADSGGALMIEGTNKIVAVLSRFAPLRNNQYSCKVGDVMIMTKLTGHFDAFLKNTIPNSLAPAAPAGPAVTSCTLDTTTIAGNAYSSTPRIGAHLKIDNVTDDLGAAARVHGEIGVGPVGTDPTQANTTGWNFFNARYAIDLSDGEYWGGAFMPFTTGNFDVTFRFSTDDGATWSYCDASPSEAGYQTASAGKLTVAAALPSPPPPPPPQPDGGVDGGGGGGVADGGI